MERKETDQLQNDAGDIRPRCSKFSPPPLTQLALVLELWCSGLLVLLNTQLGAKENWNFFFIVTTKTFCVPVKQKSL